MSLIGSSGPPNPLISHCARLPLLALALSCLPAAAAAQFHLDNGAIEATWTGADGGIDLGTVRDDASGRTVEVGPSQVSLEFGDGEREGLSRLELQEGPAVEALKAEAGASRYAARCSGSALVATYVDRPRHIKATWRAELREGSRYLRVVLDVTNTGAADVALTGVGLLHLSLAGAATVGDLNGSPVVSGTVFLGAEHPLAHNAVEAGSVDCRVPRSSGLRPGEVTRLSAVIGFTDPGQLRRGFLGYLERERAHPYRPFLHHNTWYNIGYFTRFSEADVLGVIDAFDRKLAVQRGVRLDGFVLDDGWDDPGSLWHFHAGFPEGLSNVSARAARVGAGVGIWLSPWGGYGKPKKERILSGTAAGFETRDGSFSLAGPRYYARFRDLCADVVRRNHVVYFKFDGIGSDEGPDRVDPSASRDFDAMLRLVAELRSLSPDLFVNQTTGTWPSPFWLLQVDSIWRGGEDHDFAGVGTPRERWITYRDADTYANVVRKGPLYPLNSLMLHGVIYAAHAKDLRTDPAGDFTNEVRSYFATGTQLQELYLSPELLSEADWDALAASVRWSRSRADILCDTHWIGGDPARLEVYGWGAWSPRRGVITLRNPSDRPLAFSLDVAKALELPSLAPRTYSVTGAYPDAPSPVARLVAGTPVDIVLRPFAVLVMETTPMSD